MTEPHPIRAGPSHEAAVMGLHPPCPLIDVEGDEDDSLYLHLSDEEIDVLTVDQREGEEDFDEKRFDDEMGGFQPPLQFLVPILLKKQFKTPHFSTTTHEGARGGIRQGLVRALARTSPPVAVAVPVAA